jgi:type IV pilus assembly protein PilB
MTQQQARQLAAWMVKQGYIRQQEADQALAEFESGAYAQLSHIMLQKGAITPQVHGRVLQKVTQAPFVDLEKVRPDPDVIGRISAKVARECKAIPLRHDGAQLVVAFADPSDAEALRRVSADVGEPVQAAVADEARLAEDLRQHFSGAGAAPSSMDTAADTEAFQFTEAELEAMAQDDVTRVQEIVDQGPTVLLVNMMLMRSIAAGASDIHIEPYEDGTIIRFRVDGTLYDWRNIDSRAHTHMVSRIKILAGLDTTERFVPQDGRFNAEELVRRDIDLRVSTLPTSQGEKVVMRLLDKTGARRPLSDLGMTPEQLITFERMIRRPWGMVILTGPTGSGKTTTLYAGLERIRTVQKNIMTIEDPVEYQLDRVVQVQINERQGRTFPAVLRSSLRQDPDIIMVGEMRDEETAELGVRAALTGHLVLTTLHTNDAAGAIPRLVDMNVEPYLVASSVHGVVAQRLVRRICKSCAQPYEPPHELIVWANLHEEDMEDWRLLIGEGCEKCNQTGYLGRVAIYEMMPISDSIREMAVENAGSTEIRRQAEQEGMELLRDQAQRLVADGTTTLDEMVAATAL